MPPECCCSSSSYGASALPEPVQLVHPVPARWSLEQGHHCRRKEKIESKSYFLQPYCDVFVLPAPHG